jgi:hypothetical protein
MDFIITVVLLYTFHLSWYFFSSNVFIGVNRADCSQ